MAYNKNSGESKLRKDADPNEYTHKKNKNIFKNSQTSPPPPKSKRKTGYEWDIPEVNIPVTGEFEYDTGRKNSQRKEYDSSRYEDREFRNSSEYERNSKKEESRNRQESLSFTDIILIIAANLFVPIVGGFIYYIAMSARGNRQKAAHSVVLSAIVSIIRIIYLPAIFFFR
jgi:hypothetical protein